MPQNLWRRTLFYGAIGLAAGAAIALQIALARVFAVGSWAHFGSLVVSLAMLGFGLSSVVLSMKPDWCAWRWRSLAGPAVALMAPAIIASHFAAQRIPFNAIFIASDPAQTWRLAGTFLLYLVPFVLIAFFLGIVFLKNQRAFEKVYSADMVGAGAAGLLTLAVMYLLPPEHLILLPAAMTGLAAIVFLVSIRRPVAAASAAALAAASIAAHLFVPPWLNLPELAISDYKGIAYARRFPDAQRLYRDVSPFGDVQIYRSSYLHFAPGLSDNAAFNLKTMPQDAYLGLYIDGDGPIGVMRSLAAAETDYFRFLPMNYPYLLKKAPDVFVLDFGGDIASMVALRNAPASLTVAENNPAILKAFETELLRSFTNRILERPEVRVVPYTGRLFLKNTERRYDVIDLSLADSTGLSNPGGFPIVEKYDYTLEAMRDYMRALKPSGILSITVWNKEEPPKSVLKLYATMVQAARGVLASDPSSAFFVTSTFLSTTTILYKNGGFTPAEVATLEEHTRAMSFDEIYAPDFAYDGADAPRILDDYRRDVFGDEAGAAPPVQPQPGKDGLSVENETGANAPPPNVPVEEVLPSTQLQRTMWHELLNGTWRDVAPRYVFDTRPLTNERPYFAGYVRPWDLPMVLRAPDRFQDDWGYLVLWATLAVAGLGAAVLITLPVLANRSGAIAHSPGKLACLIYFACLGFGYIVVEVDFLSLFKLALDNATVAVAVVITAMLIFSGLGSLASGRLAGAPRWPLPLLLLTISVLLIVYAILLPPVLNWIGVYGLVAKITLSLLLIAPLAFLMGFPMPVAMARLGRQSKSEMFVWAWGVNGCFSVLGAAAVPLLAIQFGLSVTLEIAGTAYLIAAPCFVLLSNAGHSEPVTGNGVTGPASSKISTPVF